MAAKYRATQTGVAGWYHEKEEGHIIGRTDECGCLSALYFLLENACTDLEVRVLVGASDRLRVSMITIEPWPEESGIAVSEPEQTETQESPLVSLNSSGVLQ